MCGVKKRKLDNLEIMCPVEKKKSKYFHVYCQNCKDNNYSKKKYVKSVRQHINLLLTKILEKTDES